MYNVHSNNGQQTTFFPPNNFNINTECINSASVDRTYILLPSATLDKQKASADLTHDIGIILQPIILLKREGVFLKRKQYGPLE